MTATLATPFDPALAGIPCTLVRSDGVSLPLAVQRWHDTASGQDTWLLDRCQGPTVDIGCGPGRLVAALAERGIPALGVDVSPQAVYSCLARGAPVLHRDAFAPLPGEGRWHHVLLADGNIGIGGDPVALLRRCAALVGRGGTVLVEVEAMGAGWWHGAARLEGVPTAGASAWFPWAVVGLDAVASLARSADLRLTVAHRGRRCFAELTAGTAFRRRSAVLAG